jgi:hypothetical protein
MFLRFSPYILLIKMNGTQTENKPKITYNVTSINAAEAIVTFLERNKSIGIPPEIKKTFLELVELGFIKKILPPGLKEMPSAKHIEIMESVIEDGPPNLGYKETLQDGAERQSYHKIYATLEQIAHSEYQLTEKGLGLVTSGLAGKFVTKK